MLTLLWWISMAVIYVEKMHAQLYVIRTDIRSYRKHDWSPYDLGKFHVDDESKWSVNDKKQGNDK